MAHRLIKPLSKIDRILKTRIFLGIVNKLVQVQPRCTEFGKFMSQSTVLLSHEPSKGSDKSAQPKINRGNNGKTKGNGNVEKKSNAANKTRNQNSQFGGNNGGGWDGKKNNREAVFDEDNVALKVWLVFTVVGGILLCLYLFWRKYKQRSEIIWEDFVNNYLVRGRVVKLEVVNKKWALAQISS